MFNAEITDLHSHQYQSCFSHADLCLRNIIIDNGKVAALINWEPSSWYLKYWEYTKAYFGMLGMVDWYAEFKSAMIVTATTIGACLIYQALTV